MDAAELAFHYLKIIFITQHKVLFPVSCGSEGQINTLYKFICWFTKLKKILNKYSRIYIFLSSISFLNIILVLKHFHVWFANQVYVSKFDPDVKKQDKCKPFLVLNDLLTNYWWVSNPYATLLVNNKPNSGH